MPNRIMKRKCARVVLSLVLLIGYPVISRAFVPEKLDRGLVAVKTSEGVFISWRYLSTDSDSTLFELYRDGEKIGDAPFVLTNYLDADGCDTSHYVVKTFCGGKELESSQPVTPWQQPYLRIHLDRPEEGVTPPFHAINRGRDLNRPDGERYRYIPGDCSVGDVDGDGQYEIVLRWDPTNARDNSFRGYTGEVYLDCYKLDGTRLWRINLGKNIRAGAHYTQFMVYDLDGDGRSEVACKTAPGTVDGAGAYVLLEGDDPRADYRTPTGDQVVGTIMDGPEYLTVFDGETGAALSTVPYQPGRDITRKWGDDKANRSERYLACVACLDGVHPSLVMCRGYYTNAYLAAYDFDGTQLKLRWFHRSERKGKGLYGEGAHSLSVADVDGDGRDEIIYGAAVLDHDGTVLHRTGLEHGDALHVSDLMPDRPGLEIFMIHEEAGGADVRDARTGEILFREDDDKDTGRGVAADIDPRYRGFEFWSLASSNIYSTDGFKVIARGRIPVNFRIYWDGDLCDELLDGTRISKWIPEKNRCETYVDFRELQPVSSCNGSKKTPSISADILGDWREEVILWDRTTASDLVLFTTTAPTPYRIPTLMHDPVYRMSIVWQNVAYNQPPHLGFYLPDRYGR